MSLQKENRAQVGDIDVVGKQNTTAANPHGKSFVGAINASRKNTIVPALNTGHDKEDEKVKDKDLETQQIGEEEFENDKKKHGRPEAGEAFAEYCRRLCAGDTLPYEKVLRIPKANLMNAFDEEMTKKFRMKQPKKVKKRQATPNLKKNPPKKISESDRAAERSLLAEKRLANKNIRRSRYMRVLYSQPYCRCPVHCVSDCVDLCHTGHPYTSLQCGQNSEPCCGCGSYLHGQPGYGSYFSKDRPIGSFPHNCQSYNNCRGYDYMDELYEEVGCPSKYEDVHPSEKREIDTESSKLLVTRAVPNFSDIRSNTARHFKSQSQSNNCDYRRTHRIGSFRSCFSSLSDDKKHTQPFSSSPLPHSKEKRTRRGSRKRNGKSSTMTVAQLKIREASSSSDSSLDTSKRKRRTLSRRRRHQEYSPSSVFSNFKSRGINLENENSESDGQHSEENITDDSQRDFGHLPMASVQFCTPSRSNYNHFSQPSLLSCSTRSYNTPSIGDGYNTSRSYGSHEYATSFSKITGLSNTSSSSSSEDRFGRAFYPSPVSQTQLNTTNSFLQSSTVPQFTSTDKINLTSFLAHEKQNLSSFVPTVSTPYKSKFLSNQTKRKSTSPTLPFRSDYLSREYTYGTLSYALDKSFQINMATSVVPSSGMNKIGSLTVGFAPQADKLSGSTTIPGRYGPKALGNYDGGNNNTFLPAYTLEDRLITANRHNHYPSYWAKRSLEKSLAWISTEMG